MIICHINFKGLKTIKLQQYEPACEILSLLDISYNQEDLSFILMNVGGTRGGLIILLEDVLRLISLEDFNS